MRQIIARTVSRPTVLALFVITLVIPFVGNAQTPAPRRVRTVDNQRLFVDRSTLPPGMRQQMHVYDYDCYIVMLTPGEIEVTVGEQKTTGPQPAGTSWYIPKTTSRAFANVGKEPYDLIVVSLR